MHYHLRPTLGLLLNLIVLHLHHHRRHEPSSSSSTNQKQQKTQKNNTQKTHKSTTRKTLINRFVANGVDIESNRKQGIITNRKQVVPLTVTYTLKLETNGFEGSPSKEW